MLQLACRRVLLGCIAAVPGETSVNKSSHAIVEDFCGKHHDISEIFRVIALIETMWNSLFASVTFGGIAGISQPVICLDYFHRHFLQAAERVPEHLATRKASVQTLGQSLPYVFAVMFRG